MFFDMPLNAHPPTIDAASFEAKLAAAQAKSLVDFGLWGGLVLGNQDNLEELSDCGVVGFKAFMCDSGVADFLSVDDQTLREGMKRVAKLGKLVAVHAESEAIARELTLQAVAAGRTSIRDYLDSRPIQAELDAIQRAIALAGETGCALHLVHVSCGTGVALVVAAQKQGVNVTCETCPHYLVLTEEDMVQLGSTAKSAPPLRPKPERNSLWECVRAGQVTTIASDHSPSPSEMKADADFFKVWSGIASVQHTLPLLLTEWNSPDPKTAFHSIARLTSFNVAERFGLPVTKGRLAVGADADLALVDLRISFELHAEDLLYRHKLSPYFGRALTGRVVRTILRGQTVFQDGKIVATPSGQFVEPVNP
jgi:allantoinase